MKLTTWNCARGFDGKKDAIFSSAPDIVVIQECSKKSVEANLFEEYEGIWVGENSAIGMAVFYRKADWHVRQLTDSMHGLQWVVPFNVTGPENFTLIAVWACAIKSNRRDSYVGQVNRALQEHPEWFTRGPVVVAGDFNSNAIWDQKRPGWNHSTMVAAFEKHGLSSIYHAVCSETHGEETTPTFHLQKNRKKPFHLDYVFVPNDWKPRVEFEVGDCSDWLALSDHCPLTITLSSASNVSA